MNDVDSKKLTTEIFHNRASAEQAYQQAIKHGYEDKDINIMMSEETKKNLADSFLIEKEEGNKATEGLGIGGAAGLAVGGFAGAIAALGTNLIIPGLGLIVAGPLAAGLAGAGAGGIAGGLLGTLIGFGIPEEKARIYEKDLQAGGILIGVDEKTNSPDLKRNWQSILNINHSYMDCQNLIGKEVIDNDQNSVGTIKTLVLNQNTGKIPYLILSVSKFLGLNNKLFVVPWNSIQTHTTDNTIILKMNKEQLEAAPAYDHTSLPDLGTVAWAETIENHYKNYVI